MRKALFLLPLILLVTSCSVNMQDLVSVETHNSITHNFDYGSLNKIEIEYENKNEKRDFSFYHSNALFKLYRLFEKDYVSDEIDNKFLSKSSDFKQHFDVSFIDGRKEEPLKRLEYYFYNSDFGVLRIDKEKCYKVDLTSRQNLYSQLVDIESLVKKNDSYFISAKTSSRSLNYEENDVDVEFIDNKYVIEVYPVFSYSIKLSVPDDEYSIDLDSSFIIENMSSSIYFVDNPFLSNWDNLGVQFTCYFLEEKTLETMKFFYEGKEFEILFKVNEYDSSIFDFEKPTNEVLLDPNFTNVKNTIDSISFYETQDTKDNLKNDEYEYIFTDGYDLSYLSYLPCNLYYPSYFINNPTYYYSYVNFTLNEGEMDYFLLESGPFDRIYWTGETRPYIAQISFKAIKKSSDNFYKHIFCSKYEFFFEYMYNKNNFLQYSVNGINLYMNVINNKEDPKYLYYAFFIFEDNNFYYTINVDFYLDEWIVFI